jgi:SAM-dependent methyltransferase
VKGNDKASKLREKPTRIPSIQLQRKGEVIRAYLGRVAQRPELSEYARGVAFVQLLKDLLLDADPQFLQDYLAGMERSLAGPKTALYNRGRPDALYGNLVIEFKRSLTKSREDAEGQLRKYLALLFSRADERQRPLIGMATDGIQFVAFAPRFPVDAPSLAPADIELKEIESVNVDSMKPEEAYYWLDRYFTRQTGPIAPRTQQIVNDFGPSSGSFIHAMNVLDGLWKGAEKDGELQVFYETWQKYLRITYGGPVAEAELFLRHTYLATLAKLMVWVRLTAATEPPDDRQLRTILNGQYFTQRGIQNFLEEDFFAWVARDAAWPQALTMSRRLLIQLATYNLRELSEDVLKGLYERLVDPKDRHDLGEYYTPDWLAAKVVKECLEDNPGASVLDPACGSGTFLYQTVLFKRDKLGDTAKTLRHIEGNVVGIDIHPLAVIVAKTTYLLGLGDLLEKRGKAIRIPVYLADSVKPPERFFAGYRAILNGAAINFPDDLALSGELYDRAIELCSEYARSTAREALPSVEMLINFIRRNQVALAEHEAWRDALYELFKVLREKIRDRKDTIWAFILKNVFKPLLLKERFQVVVGNPPWLSYRYVEKGAYQEFLKEQIVKRYRLLTGRPELLTHMELGTLFFVRSADLYLQDRGRIGFVLPKSVFVADQHHALREGSHSAQLRLRQVWDLEGASPLFNVPASVAFGERSPQKTAWPLPGRIIAGELEVRNASPAEAEQHLTEAPTEYWLCIRGDSSYFNEKRQKPVKEGSPYGEKFAQGATIVPRSFWFVQVQKTPGLGYDPTRPYVRTDPRAIKAAKEQYRDVRLEGTVEAEFLYSTLLSTDVVPFGHLPSRTALLPILWKPEGYTMLTAKEARKQGYIGLAEWLEKCETLWKDKRGEKAGRESIYSWLDYRKKLTQQRRKRHTVLYTTSGTYLSSAVIDNGSGPLGSRRLIVESVLYSCDFDDPDEADFLVALLNSPFADSQVKPLQAIGAFGPRHFHKKVWSLPIPLYERTNKDHRELAALSAACTRRAGEFLTTLPPSVLQGSLGRLRNLVRDAVGGLIRQIDELTRSVLNAD